MERSRCNSSCTSCSTHPIPFTPNHRSVVANSANYEDLPEPEAPVLSLGERVLWVTDYDRLSGIVRWIGRIPQLYYGWSVGVEFDIPVLNGGNGYINGRRYFSSPDGHALFLPSTELTTENSFVEPPPRVCNHRMCSENGLEVCCNHHPMSYRDSTYGHFRQDCHCSNSRNDYPCSSRCCGPVYGHISARPALRHVEHPHESHCSQALRRHHYDQLSIPNHSPLPPRLSDDYVDCGSNVQHLSSSPLRSSRVYNDDDERERPFKAFYHNDRLTPVDLPYKHSFFNPRSTIRLISGLKEWVSCWVLGTSKRKKNQSMILKGRKTVTSLIVSQTPQSMNKTGQRLSSFSNYACVDYCTLRKNNQNEVKSSSQNAVSKLAVDMTNSEPLKIECADKRPEVKRRRHKKRPAPLPPSQQPAIVKSDTSNVRESGSTIRRNRSFTIVTNSSKLTFQTQGNRHSIRRKGHTTADSSNIAKSSRTNSVPQRKRKKRPAPLPPIQDKSYHKINNEVVENKHTLNGVQAFDGEDDDWEIIPDSALFLYNSLTDNDFKFADDVRYVKNKKELESVNGNSGRDSISISDEERDGVLSDGIASYPFNQADVSNTKSNFPDTFDVPSRKNDTRFKISIEKREMNVVTVEEVPQSSDGEDDDDNVQSSLSELSDSEEAQINDGKFKNMIADNSKSSSSEESSQPVDPKPIFKELQLTPPPKACVKDFVNAFNMLADRERFGDRDVKSTENKKPSTSFASVEPAPPSTETDANTSKCIKSFPTKWQFQKNGSNYSTGHFLLPIEEEESHNELSESETQVSGSMSDNSQLNKTKWKQNHDVKATKSSEALQENKQISETGSKSLSRKHQAPIKHVDKNYLNLKNTDAPMKKIDRNRELETKISQLVNSHSQKISRASDIAVSSLLNEKPPKGPTISKINGVKLKNWGSSKIGKAAAKPDQPIMVSLYIEDKSSHRGPMPLLVTPSMTLRKLKKQVEKEYNFDKDLQCWILGETFAIHDEATLASYGVVEAGFPILLYVMSMESKANSLPLKSSFKAQRAHIYDDVAHSSSDSETEDIENVLDREIGRSFRRTKQSKPKDLPQKPPVKHPRLKLVSKSNPKVKSDFHKAWEKEFTKTKDYHALVKLDDLDLVTNVEAFECPICFLDIDVGDGAVLQECLHSFCKECLAAAVQFSETAMIKCPFRNDEYSCESHLQEREIKSLVTPEVFERHLQRSMALAESQAQDSFHCKTPDCPGWCLYEDNVNTFLCPVCKRTNCVTCAAVHEGRNCRQYQDDVANRCDSSEEAKKTKEYLDNMVKDGEAMKCPKCEVILMKKWGCDWLKCSMCHTEVCWVTKGPRWGPDGRGDTSGGCKCMLNGVRCHPKCNYCH